MNTTSIRMPQLAVKFFYASYDPATAFDLFTAETVPLEAKATDPLLREWQPARPGATLADVREYMQEHGLRLLGAERIGQRRRRTWEGLYVATIGTLGAAGKELAQ